MSVIRIPYTDVCRDSNHFFWDQGYAGKYICLEDHLVPINHVLAVPFWTRMHVFRPNFRYGNTLSKLSYTAVRQAKADNRLRFRFLLCMAMWRTVYAVRMVGVKRWRQWQDDVVRRRNEAVLTIARNASASPPPPVPPPPWHQWKDDVVHRRNEAVLIIVRNAIGMH